MSELNREQIIKALECCKTPSASDCDACGYTGKCLENGEYMGCVNLLVVDALSLIKELTEENDTLYRLIGETLWQKVSIKADTVRKMVAELDKYFVEHNEIKYGGGLIHKVLKQVAKEMLEGNTASDNKCVACGDIIPEGRQVCPNCEEGEKRK